MIDSQARANELAELLATILNQPIDPTFDAHLVEDYGATSMDMVDIVEGLERRFGISIPNREIQTLVRFSDLLARICSAQAAPMAESNRCNPVEQTSNGGSSGEGVDATVGILESVGKSFCRTNGIAPQILFERYSEAGFLYPAKRQRLAPFMGLITENWRRALTLGDQIMRILSYEDSKYGDHWGSVSSWQTTACGWLTQHTIANHPRASQAVVLGVTEAAMQDHGAGLDHAHELWFRPSNRFSTTMFGSMDQAIGSSSAWLGKHQFLAVGASGLRTLESPWPVERCTELDQDELQVFAKLVRGPVYIAGEGLDSVDLELQALDDLYRRADLRRYRRIFFCRRRPADDIVAAAVAYRGPLGLNFSFLENRCDLILSSSLSEPDSLQAAQSLLATASALYANFEPQFIPVITDTRTSRLLVEAGAEHLREYWQLICLADGYDRFYGRLKANFASRTHAHDQSTKTTISK